jgi:RsiW-degrading membrane proteinase PrsW (M82 family)/TM2 domain-containing membrane protein YozV
MPASKTTAVLLALFLGSFGAHRFYLHRWGSGVLYLLFFWTGIPTVLGVIEAIRLALMSEQTFAKKYSSAVQRLFSPDSAFYWNGRAWLPTLSPDGRWRWNGHAWVPTVSLEAPAEPDQTVVTEAKSLAIEALPLRPSSAESLSISNVPPASGVSAEVAAQSTGGLGGPPDLHPVVDSTNPIANAIVAASPQSNRHHGYGLAVALGAVFLGALALGAVFDTILDLKSGIGVITVAELVLSTVLVGLTYFFVWVFNRFTHDRKKRHRHLVVATIISAILFVLAMSFMPGVFVAMEFGAFLIAVPGTAFGLWVWRRLGRDEREPWRLVLVTVAWGGILAINFALVFEDILGVFIGSSPGVGQALGAGVFEEIPKGVAVLLLARVFRDEFDGVIDGVVYGAAVGLGFNLVETLGAAGMDGTGQLVVRQTLGLFLGHPLWTALIGAGIGAARQQPSWWKRSFLVVGGFLTAMFGHFTWDAVLMTGTLVPIGVLIELGLVGLLIYVVVVARRAEGRSLKQQLQAEAATGIGAIAPQEVAVLESPHLRARQRRHALQQQGLRGFRRLGQLQQAQIDLALERWHRARQQIDEPTEAEEHLRRKVLTIKANMQPVAAVAPVQ